MKRIVSLMCVLLVGCLSVSLVSAQQTPQPVVRLGNWIEVGNDVFMHIIGTADIRYKTTQNFDFEDKVRDRTSTRSPSSTVPHDAVGDLTWAELRLGAEFRYQKNLQLYLLFEHQQVFDGNLIDDRSNTSNPGGTDIFGRAASTENPGFRTERYWIDYKFAGTPFRMRVGADLWQFDQAGTNGDDTPRIALFGDFGDFYAEASVVQQLESQRLGLTNDNDYIFYMFKGGYNFKPHKVELGVVYYRDRFNGADTQAGAVAFRGQKTDAVWINASWTGKVGPVRGLLQGNLTTGTARGGTGLGLPAGVQPGRKYDIFAGGVVAYAEADFGIVRPFVGFIWGSGDGDARDNKLHGFVSNPFNDSTAVTGNGFMNHLDTSTAFALRDYSCPAGAQGVRGTPPAGNPYAVGSAVLGSGNAAGSGFAECAHSTSNVWNDRIGLTSHVGLSGVTYSSPGTWDIPVGIRVFPLKGHEINGWYVYRAVVSTGLLETAFAPEIAAGQISRIHKTLYHEVGGSWQWTLNPHFDIRLAGNIGIPGEGYKDLAKLADCNLNTAGRQACSGNDIALKGEARFRARF